MSNTTDYESPGWLAYFRSPKQDENTEAQINQALDQSQMASLPLIYSGLILLFVLYALVQIFILHEPGTPTMVVVAFVSALVLGGIWVVLRQSLIPPQYANLLSAVAASLVLISMMLRLYVTADPKQTSNLALFVVAIGVLLLSARSFIWLLLITVAGWLVALFWLPWSPDWVYFGVVLLTAAFTAVMAHMARITTYRHTVLVSILHKRQKEELQRRTLQIETSSAVGQRITSILDLETLLHQVSELIRDRYPAYYVGVFLANSSGSFHTARGPKSAREGMGNASGYRILVSNNGLIALVLRSGKALLVADVRQEPDYVSAETLPSTRSELILPLKMGARVLGVLDFQSDRLNEFREQEVAVFQLLADQVAIALENAQLYEETRKFNQQLEDKVRQRTAALQDAYQELERLNKTKSDFISITSHELRTPLTIVSFNNQMLMSDKVIQENGHLSRWTRGIDDGADRMSEIVERMLDVAKIDTQALDLSFGPVNLDSLIRQVAKSFHEALQQRELTLHIEELKLLPTIEGDVDALQKVFYHLLVNAIKYTPNGGNIRVLNRQHSDGKERPTPVPSVEITVLDTGIGINRESLQLIFQKFYQTGEVSLHSSGKTTFKGGGAGLGLAIAKGIVDAHNGRIWAESDGYDEEALPGSQFHVVLPIKQRV